MKHHSASHQLFQYVTGYQLSQAMFAANELGIAEHFGKEAVSATELAQLVEVDAKLLARLLRLLASIGVFEETEKDVFILTEMGQCLRKDHPESLYYAIHSHTHLSYTAWGNLTDSFQTGKNAFETHFKHPYFDYLKANETDNYIFNRYMKQRSQFYVQGILQSYDFSEAKVLMDVGGGHGHILRGILAQNPRLKGILFDQAHVLEDAKKEDPDLSSVCELVAGNFFEPIPNRGADSILMKYILHDWPDAECLTILKQCHNALPEAGYLFIAETVIENCSNNQGTEAKLLDMHMHVLLSAQERTIDEFETLFAQAGFKLERVIPTETMVSIIVARKC